MSDNEAFNKCTTDASTRGDFVAEANAKSAAALWLAYCEKKMELETAQERIETLEAALRVAAGYISTKEGHTDQHPQDVYDWIVRAALAGEKKDE